MAVNHLLAFLFLLTFKTGFSAEISVFVKTGDSVQLDIHTQKLPEFDDLFWKKNKSENIVKYTNEFKKEKRYPSWNDRVDFNTETFSLTLKNMQRADSGLYEAIAIGILDKIIVTYRVFVTDAVKAPVLTVNSNRSSSDSCTVNFTCRAQDLTINSSYQNNRCSPEEETSINKINTLTLNCSEESIICIHSNPVSWDKDRIYITQLCVNNKKENDSSVNQTESSIQFLPYVLVAVCLFLAIAISLILYKKCKKGAQEAYTVYDQVEMQKTNSESHTYDVPGRVHDQTQQETGNNRPNTTYCTVGQHQKPADPIETDVPDYVLNLVGAEGANTVYDQVEVRDQKQQEDNMGDNRPNTTYCTVGQQQRPADPIETDRTIYAQVSKPTKKPPSISSD